MTNGNVGFIKIFRNIVYDWKWRDPQHWKAWTWLVLNASYQDTGDLKQAQIKTTIRQLSKVSGMSKAKTFRFLKRCEEEKDIFWKRAITNFPASRAGETNSETGHETNSETNASLITLRNYDECQSQAPNGETEPETESETKSETLLKNKKEKKEVQEKEKNSRSDERGMSDHHKIFDFFVQERRKAIGVDDWNPTNGAMMGKNIKVLLRQYGVDKTIRMITNYFADPKMSNRAWPWTLFFNDPIQWIEARGSPKLARNFNWKLTEEDVK